MHEGATPSAPPRLALPRPAPNPPAPPASHDSPPPPNACRLPPPCTPPYATEPPHQAYPPIHGHPQRAPPHLGLPRPQAFKVQKHLEYHMLLHSQPDAFACPDCGKNFSNPCGSIG